MKSLRSKTPSRRRHQLGAKKTNTHTRPRTSVTLYHPPHRRLHTHTNNVNSTQTPQQLNLTLKSNLLKKKYSPHDTRSPNLRAWSQQDFPILSVLIPRLCLPSQGLLTRRAGFCYVFFARQLKRSERCVFFPASCNVFLVWRWVNIQVKGEIYRCMYPGKGKWLKVLLDYRSADETIES